MSQGGGPSPYLALLLLLEFCAQYPVVLLVISCSYYVSDQDVIPQPGIQGLQNLLKSQLSRLFSPKMGMIHLPASFNLRPKSSTILSSPHRRSFPRFLSSFCPESIQIHPTSFFLHTVSLGSFSSEISLLMSKKLLKKQLQKLPENLGTEHTPSLSSLIVFCVLVVPPQMNDKFLNGRERMAWFLPIPNA